MAEDLLEVGRSPVDIHEVAGEGVPEIVEAERLDLGVPTGCSSW